jgi:hypothetical protein
MGYGPQGGTEVDVCLNEPFGKCPLSAGMGMGQVSHWPNTSVVRCAEPEPVL